MRLTRPAALCLAACAVLTTPGGPATGSITGGPAAESALAVRQGQRWVEWWRLDAAPVEWRSPLDRVQRAVSWRRGSAGLEWGELRLAGRGEARRVRVIVARLDPTRVRLALDTAWTRDGRPGWSLDDTGPETLLAINAGQFPRVMPWGWVVLAGRELMPPGRGPLAVGLAFDSAGSLRWLDDVELADHRSRRGIVEGFQSYPRLLDQGRVPERLRVGGQGVDLRHRDARLAFGQTPDGKILIALTRFDGLDGTLDFVPFGLTVPEMAAVMGALGAANAVLLDGGISSQLLIRDDRGVHRWKGLRRVPLGLVVTTRG